MTYVLKVRRRYRGHLDYKNNLHINQLHINQLSWTQCVPANFTNKNKTNKYSHKLFVSLIKKLFTRITKVLSKYLCLLSHVITVPSPLPLTKP